MKVEIIGTHISYIIVIIVIIISANGMINNSQESRQYWMDDSKICHNEKRNMVEQSKYDELSINREYWYNRSQIWFNKYKKCNDLGYKVYDSGVEWKDLATECTNKIVRLSNTGYIYNGYSKTYWCSPLELW